MKCCASYETRNVLHMCDRTQWPQARLCCVHFCDFQRVKRLVVELLVTAPSYTVSVNWRSVDRIDDAHNDWQRTRVKMIDHPKSCLSTS